MTDDFLTGKHAPVMMIAENKHNWMNGFLWRSLDAGTYKGQHNSHDQM